MNCIGEKMKWALDYGRAFNEILYQNEFTGQNKKRDSQMVGFLDALAHIGLKNLGEFWTFLYIV